MRGRGNGLLPHIDTGEDRGEAFLPFGEARGGGAAQAKDWR